MGLLRGATVRGRSLVDLGLRRKSCLNKVLLRHDNPMDNTKMKKNKIVFFIILILQFSILLISTETDAAKPMPKSYVVLKIGDKTYKSGATIPVRKGEKITIEAVVMGGRRAWCLHPDSYANIGSHTKIVHHGENGLSFVIGAGNFRGEWNLEKEIAVFQVNHGINVTPQNEQYTRSPVLQRRAELEFTDDNIAQTFIKVRSTAFWRYISHSPGGRREKHQTQQAEGIFYFKITSDKNVWFSSANIVAKGTKDDDIRWRLNNIQAFYNTIEQQIIKGKYALAEKNIRSLKGSIDSLKKDIDQKRKKHPTFSCSITFIGLPTDKVMEHRNRLYVLDKKLKELYFITEANAQKINDLLLNTQGQFSANVLKSVLVNYINWGTPIPTGYADFLTLYDPNLHLAPFDLPRKFMGWWESANKDASILANQVKTIRILSELRKFYLKRMKESVEEKKHIHKLINRLKTAKQVDNSLKAYFSSLRWVTWRGK